jgi:hypothetical protein
MINSFVLFQLGQKYMQVICLVLLPRSMIDTRNREKQKSKREKMAFSSVPYMDASSTTTKGNKRKIDNCNKRRNTRFAALCLRPRVFLISEINTIRSRFHVSHKLHRDAGPVSLGRKQETACNPIPINSQKPDRKRRIQIQKTP